MNSNILLTGEITEISHHIEPEKIVVTLSLGQCEKAFIEFRAKRAAMVVPYSAGDEVAVSVLFKGQVSKAGKQYNNLVGRSIRRHNQ